MKNLFLIFGLSMATVANAETFTCEFTEPFVTLTYSTGTEALTKKDDATGQVQVLKKVSFLILASGEYSLRNAAGNEVVRLKLDGQGSDGMSDMVYPYSASTNLISGANNGIGGCSSVALKTKPGQG
jgi:uncharacterized membrane protein